MGTGQQAKKKGARSKNKQYKRKVWLCNRDKDIDQIQDEFEKQAESGIPVAEQIVPAYDDELPGGGQFYCPETARHFISAKALEDHKRTKFYKRRVKELQEEKYTQGTADWAAGKSKEKLPPAHNDKKDVNMESK
jgi:bud site selection protein 20